MRAQLRRGSCDGDQPVSVGRVFRGANISHKGQRDGAKVYTYSIAFLSFSLCFRSPTTIHTPPRPTTPFRRPPPYVHGFTPCNIAFSTPKPFGYSSPLPHVNQINPNIYIYIPVHPTATAHPRYIIPGAIGTENYKGYKEKNTIYSLR